MFILHGVLFSINLYVFCILFFSFFLEISFHSLTLSLFRPLPHSFSFSGFVHGFPICFVLFCSSILHIFTGFSCYVFYALITLYFAMAMAFKNHLLAWKPFSPKRSLCVIYGVHGIKSRLKTINLLLVVCYQRVFKKIEVVFFFLLLFFVFMCTTNKLYVHFVFWFWFWIWI